MQVDRYQFTHEDRSRGGIEAARVRTEAQHARMMRHAGLWQMMEGMERAHVPNAMLAVVLGVAARLADADLPDVETPLDASRLIEVAEKAHRIMRLELGESTSNNATASVTAELANRLSALEGERAPDDASDVVDVGTGDDARDA